MAASTRRPTSWTLRKSFWNRIALFKFRGNKPVAIPIPSDNTRPIEAVPLVSQFPGIPIANILVGDSVPEDEASKPTQVFYAFQVKMYSSYSPMQSGLPSIDQDPKKALDEAFTARHRKHFSVPTLPTEYAGETEPDLGFLAVAGPYSGYLEKAPRGGYQWDLQDLSNYEYYEGLYPLGVTVRFGVDERSRTLQAEEITSTLGVHTPTDPQWGLAKKIALCAVSTHVSLVRHFNWVHLASGAHLAIATRNHLPQNHPLCRLLWPHIFGSQFSNSLVTNGQMAKGGDFDSIFSFTHEGMCKLFSRTYEAFKIIVNDPLRDADRRGITGGEFDTPSLNNLKDLFDVIHSHTTRYIDLYYNSDEEIRQDEPLQIFLTQLDTLIPNGIEGVVGNTVTLAKVSRLIASCIYLGTVQHDLLGTSMWNYQMWVYKQPVRVYKDGRREPLDVYQRLVNANFNLNVSRRKLMDDFSYLGLDQKGRDAFTAFKEDLMALQAKMEGENFAFWKIYPRMLEANMNA
ncbi:MAG: lipoxygenase family protein [Nitrospirales bacterium]